MNFSLLAIILFFSLCNSLTHIRQLIKPDYITFDNLSEATSQKFYRRATDYLLRAGVPFAPNDVFLRKLIIAAVAPYLTNSEACSVFDEFIAFYNDPLYTCDAFLRRYSEVHNYATTIMTYDRYKKCYADSTEAFEFLMLNYAGSQFTKGINKEFYLFDVLDEPASLNEDCFQVIRTNSYWEAPCKLPHHCGVPRYYKLPYTWWGEELLVCHSIHKPLPKTFKRFGVFRFPSDSFYVNTSSTFVTTPSLAFVPGLHLDNAHYDQLHNTFYILYSYETKLFNVVPQACLMAYQKVFPNGTQYYVPLQTFRRDEELCYEIPSPDTIPACYNLVAQHGGLRWSSYPSMLLNLNIQFSVSGYMPDCSIPENNRVPRNNVTTLLSIVNGTSYVVDYDPYNRANPYTRELFTDDSYIYTKSHCAHITTAYKNFGVSSVVDYVFAAITNSFRSLISLLEEELVSLFEYVFRILLKALSILASYFPVLFIPSFLVNFTSLFAVSGNAFYSAYFSALLSTLLVLLN